MSDELEFQRKLAALEQRAESLRATTRRLQGELSAQQERCAQATKASETLTARLAEQTQRRATLQAALKRLHDLTYAKLLRGGGEDAIEASLKRMNADDRSGR